MKRFNYYVSMLLLMVIAVGCNEDFDTPPIVVPTAQHKPNMTIAEFKEKYWQDVRNFCDTIKDDVVIHGWVSSSDEAGNIYKYLYIKDETAGIGISVDASGLNTTYRVGQEVVLNMKNRWIGKYNGQYLIGIPEWYAAQSVWEAGRLSLQTLTEFMEINGLPDKSKVQPVVTKITDFVGKSDKETQLKYQGQLVRINNVKWQGADGEIPYCEADKNTTRVLVDADGNEVNVSNSMYATFRADPMPMGEGDVIAIAYMTGADKWALYIRDTNDCIGFDNNTKGTAKNPYTVEEAIAEQGNQRSGWVEGYIVGAVAPEVTTVSSNASIEWKAPTTLDNTIVIADDPDCVDYSKCIVVALPQGTPFRAQANLRDNDAAYKTVIKVKGDLAPYMGTSGITGNSGSLEEFVMSIVTGGITELEEGFDSGLPTTWVNIKVSGDKAWYQTTFNNNGYAAMTGYKGTNPPFDAWLITPALDIKKAKSKILTFSTQVNGYGSTTSVFEVYVLNNTNPQEASVKVKLNPNIATAPASGYSSWAESGDLDLSQWADGSYYIGFRFYATADANYATWCVDNVKFGLGGAGAATGDDFETMNSGKPTASFGNLTSTAGWTAT
ncbi:MAG: choice-of-anchor J domain-containing protein, partial [Muribaculaceae bacterium]|nr:choice-of-anchor J domain-containing protein [Muribaculaceae bacterium]